MTTSKHYVLANFMAIFPVAVDPKADQSRSGISSSDIDLSGYLASKREYSDLALRPVLVEKDDSDSLIAQLELLGEGVVIASYLPAYYHVEILNEEVSQYALCDALGAAMALSQVRKEELFLIPIELSDIDEQRRMSTKALLTRRNAALDLHGYIEDYIPWTRSKYNYLLEDRLWMLATTLVKDEVLLYAAFFIREAFRDYQFLSNDDVLHTLHNNDHHPDTISEGVRIENAIHNCYKAIEAIHGGNLPQDEAKIVKNFQVKGIDLTELTGYKFEEIDQQPAIEKVVALRLSRNYKSAHGRISANRKSTFYELMDFQQLTIHVVTTAIYFRNSGLVELPD